MKKCPKCQSVFTDDSLSFCLTDGTALQFFRDPDETLPAYDPNETLVYPAAQVTNPTLVDPQPAPPRQVVVPVESVPAQSPPPVTPPQVIRQGVSPVIVGALAGLLILAVGGLAAFALRDYFLPATTTATPTPTPAPQPTPQKEIIVVRETPAETKPEPTQPPVETPPETRGTPGRFPQASQRNLSGGDLAELNCGDLKIMRNEIFARHGFIFKTPDMAGYFSRQSWYRGTSRDVTARLSATERGNIAVIKSYEEGLRCE
jgi:hypothetical protein